MTRLLPAMMLIATAALLTGDAVHFYPQMPEQMSSHYGWSGAANGWMSRDSFFALLGITAGGVVVLFLGLAKFLPRIPDALINVPDKARNLSPENRARTLAWISSLLLWLGCGTVAFLAAVFHFVYLANASGSHRLVAPMGWLTAGFLTCYATLIGLMHAKLRSRRQPRS